MELIGILFILFAVLAGFTLLVFVAFFAFSLFGGLARTITINDLSEHLTMLANGQTEYPCVGIHSGGADCIYFRCEDGMFNIDFEVMTKEQLPYIDQLENYAKERQIRTATTTYGTSPNEKFADTAPVLQLITNSDLESTVEIARDIQANVFGNTDDTIYEVVP